MATITAHEIELYAVNTSGLYEANKRLARQEGSIEQWRTQVRHFILPCYRNEIDRNARASVAAVAEAAQSLREYYARHVAEIAQCEVQA